MPKFNNIILIKIEFFVVETNLNALLQFIHSSFGVVRALSVPPGTATFSCPHSPPNELRRPEPVKTPRSAPGSCGHRGQAELSQVNVQSCHRWAYKAVAGGHLEQ